MVAAGAARPVIWQYGIAVLLPLIALPLTGLTFSLERSPFFPLFSLAVVLAAIYGGKNSGFSATAVSALLNVIALPPRFSLRVSDTESLVRVIVFAIVGCVVSVLIGLIGELQATLDVERERLATTLASIGDSVITTDAEGRVTFLNRVAEATSGWTAVEARGTPLEEVFCIVNERTREPVANPVQKVITTGRIAGLANHTVLIRKDKSEIPIDDSAAPIRDNQGNIAGVVLVFRDVSRERQSQAAVIRAEKLASVGRLAASIAHEINNPLEAVSNLLYLIESAPDVSAQSRNWADTAQRELSRAAHVARQTLSFARRTEKRELVPLDALVDEVLALYANRLNGKGVQVLRRYRDHAVAEVSCIDVKQVTANLIANSFDALPAGGTLHLRLTTTHWNGSPRVRLTVADKGNGIAAEHLPHVFEPFFSTKDGTGTGLGLWVIKEIVEGHKGCVHLRSRIGKGTVVTVCWPAMAAVDRKGVRS